MTLPHDDTAVLEFDPAAVTPEMCAGLSSARLRQVIEHHKLPQPPKSSRKDDLVKWARAAISAHALASEPVAEPEPEQVSAPEPPGTDMELHEPKPSSVVPTASRWQLIVQMAEYLSTSNLTPDILRGPGKVHDLGSILLRANDLGIPLTAALEQLYVIKGKVGMESKLMRALARRDGHHISDDPASDKFCAIVHGVRADNGDTATAYFDLDDAVDFGLIKGYTKHDDGRITIEGDKDKPQWVKDTRNMLKQRATARLCRDLFSDCLAGVSYTPDELGYIEVEASEEGPGYGKAGEPEPTMTVNQQRSEIARRIAELPEDLRKALAKDWSAKNLPRTAQLTPGAIRTALTLLEGFERTAHERDNSDDIADAEIVDEEGVASTSTEGTDEPGPDAGDGGTAPAEGSPLDDVDAAASSVLPGAEASDGTLYCAGCGEQIDAAGVVAWDNDEQPFHPECML